MVNKNFLLLIFLCLLFQQCGVYNFTGAAVSPDIKTINIDNFINETGQGPPRLAQNFTETLRDYFQSNSQIRVVRSGGDLSMEGAVVGYAVSPVAPTAQELASLNRLTIRYKVKFENPKDSSKSFNQEFSFYADYDQKLSLSQVEDQEIQIINSQVVFDIFNKAFSNW